jgi:GNAT superfamily N-acetyltransferase
LTLPGILFTLYLIEGRIMDFIKDLGYLAVATRMKRLMERFMRGAGEVYRNLGIDFEPRYFAVFYLLSRSEDPLSISEIAAALKISHPAVIQTTQLLLKKRLVVSAQDESDRRKRLLTLSQKGKKTAEVLQPVWEDFISASEQLFQGIDVDILGVYQKIEDALDEEELSDRILRQIKKSQSNRVDIVEYRPEYKEVFKRLNEAWLRQYFEIEKRDLEVMENPEEKVLKRGGSVFFALIGGKAVGTAALLKVDEQTYELTKMAVEPSFQRKQAGRKLAEAALDKARTQGAEAVILWTDSKLHAAVSLYQKLGFEMIEASDMVSIPYKRAQCGIMMRLDLRKN